MQSLRSLVQLGKLTVKRHSVGIVLAESFRLRRRWMIGRYDIDRVYTSGHARIRFVFRTGATHAKQAANKSYRVLKHASHIALRSAAATHN